MTLEEQTKPRRMQERTRRPRRERKMQQARKRPKVRYSQVRSLRAP